MKKFLAFADGYKRVIVLGAFIIVAWLKAAGAGDHEATLNVVLRVVDWTPDASPVPMALVAGTVAGVLAIVDGIRKALAEKRAKDSTVSRSGW